MVKEINQTGRGTGGRCSRILCITTGWGGDSDRGEVGIDYKRV